MLSIALPMHGVGHANYYVELAQKDYYTAQGSEAGQWFGQGAAKLGLSGEVDSRTFEHLLRGRSPDGRSDLVQNANNPHRQTAWDLTFSAPKSMSVLWAVAPDEVREQIEAAQRQAVETALSFLEETTGLTRRGQGGKIMERAELVFALFNHYSSRAFDPLVHTHALLINLAVRQDGTTGALWSQEFFRAKMAAGAMYQVELAAGLRDRLGLVTEPARIGFQVAGVPEAVCKTFSQRGESIRARLEERNAHDARAAKQATLDTRPHKVNIEREKLMAQWRTRAEPLGWNAGQVRRLLHQCQAQPCAQRDLERRFQEEASRLPAAQRTPGRLRGLAAGVAVELGADARRFRPLLRFVPVRQQRHLRAEVRSHEAAAVMSGVRQTRSGCQTAAGHREARNVNEPHSRLKSFTSSAKSEWRNDSTAERSHAGKTAEAESHAKPSASQSEAATEKSTTSTKSSRTSRTEQPRPKATKTGNANGRQQAKTSTAAGSKSESSHRLDDQQSQQQKAKPQQEREQTKQSSGGGSRRSGRQRRRERRQSWRAAQPSEKSRVERNAEWLKRLDPRQVTTEEERKKLFFAWKEVMATGKASELFGSERKAVPRRQAGRNRKFACAFDDKVTPIPAVAQTRQRLTFHAVECAVKHRADSQSLYETLRDMRPGAERGLVSVEWRRLFPKAPKLSPVHYWKAPVVVLGHARPKPHKWGKVRWRKSLLLWELRVQQRQLFPKAPQWMPVHHWSLPALRLTANSASSKASERLDKSWQKQASSKDKDQSHSQSQ